MSSVEMRFDHVLLAFADFRQAAERLTAERGLGAIEGGRHTGWGDEATFRSWLGNDAPSVQVRPVPPALLAVAIATDQGEIVLR